MYRAVFLDLDDTLFDRTAAVRRWLFRRALRWSGQAAAECLFVGDDPVNDIAPAAALGLVTAWREREPWPSEQAPPTHRLPSIEALEQLCA